MQKAGHRPIAILGTGTTMVGDPTGKTDMRKMLTKEEIRHNAECFRRQMSKFVDEYGTSEKDNHKYDCPCAFKNFRKFAH